MVFNEDSHYQQVVVSTVGPTKRDMVLDLLIHGRVDLADPLWLEYGYHKIYAEILEACVAEDAELSAMFIGGGGYVFPRYAELTRSRTISRCMECVWRRVGYGPRQLTPFVGSCEGQGWHGRFGRGDQRSQVIDFIEAGIRGGAF